MSACPLLCRQAWVRYVHKFIFFAYINGKQTVLRCIKCIFGYADMLAGRSPRLNIATLVFFFVSKPFCWLLTITRFVPTVLTVTVWQNIRSNAKNTRLDIQFVFLLDKVNGGAYFVVGAVRRSMDYVYGCLGFLIL